MLVEVVPGAMALAVSVVGKLTPALTLVDRGTAVKADAVAVTALVELDPTSDVTSV